MNIDELFSKQLPRDEIDPRYFIKPLAMVRIFKTLSKCSTSVLHPTDCAIITVKRSTERITSKRSYPCVRLNGRATKHDLARVLYHNFRGPMHDKNYLLKTCGCNLDKTKICININHLLQYTLHPAVTTFNYEDSLVKSLPIPIPQKKKFTVNFD